MSTASLNLSARSTMGRIAAGRAGLIVFATTLLVSATLLFSVQPVFAKMVLPRLGGTPAVWAVAMCFFQATLLAGYCYAHALNRFAPWHWAPLIHLGLCVVALTALPFGLPAFADEAPTGNFYLWLVAVMTVGVGLPFFAVSASAPLLQAWFTRSGHPHADDPYFLYGASNLGSLASLLAYPFLIEPTIGLEVQRAVWAAGFLLLLPMLGVCGLLMMAGLREGGRLTDASAIINGQQVTSQAPTLSDRAKWIGLAFVPSALMVSFTTHVTTDIASAPFIWVIPLAAFLATFVIVFRDTSLIPHDVVLKAHPALAVLSLLFLLLPTSLSHLLAGGVGFLTFVVTTLVCHRALYDARPAADRLTEFYLYMSLGGVLGGFFTSIVAPQIFDIILEYPLLILAGLLARPGLIAALFDKARQEEAILIAAGFSIPGISLWVGAENDAIPVVWAVTMITGLFILAGVFVASANVPAQRAVGGVLGAFTLIAAGLSVVSQGYAERSFFGVSRVMMSSDGGYRLYYHGSTTHGGEKVFDADGTAVTDAMPMTYYHPKAPMALGFDIARASLRPGQTNLRVGVIGLGTGSLSCYTEEGDTLTFYEIDPVVDKIARNPKFFSFMTRCAPATKTVIGDARITIAKVPAASYDYLVVDAFSSDAIPVHLLTREALELFASKIPDSGLIAFHISNRYMELESVLAATAKTIPGLYMTPVFESEGLPGLDGSPSHVAFLAKEKSVIDRVQAMPGVRPTDDRGTAPWTDDFADILSALWRKW